MARKRSFFERLTASLRMDNEDADTFIRDTRDFDDDEEMYDDDETRLSAQAPVELFDSELLCDVYRDVDAIIVKCHTPGVRKGDVDIAITRETVTIQGRRDKDTMIDDDEFYYRELSWGSFARTIMLPEEVDVDKAEAVEEHGLLTITLPLVDKNREARLQVK